MRLVIDYKVQRVEDAPRDGSEVLGFFPGAGWRAIKWSGWGGGVWRCAMTGHNLLSESPTHWIPMLPAPTDGD